MNSFIFSNGKFYADGEIFEDREYLGKLTKKMPVNVCVVPTTVKTVASVEDPPEKKDKILSAHFDDTVAIQDERIGDKKFHVTGIKKDTVKGIYNTFKDSKVEKFIPYGLAIRAFLNTVQIDCSDKVIVFIDDLKDQTLVTLLNGPVYTSTSKLVFKDATSLISEIQRYQQKFASNYSKQTAKEFNFAVVTNNKQIYEHLNSTEDYADNKPYYVEEEYPSLQGLETAKFNVHFLPLEDAVKQKRMLLFRNKVKYTAGASACALLGLAFFVSTNVFKANLENKLNRMNTLKAETKNQLLIENRKKYKSYIQQKASNWPALVVFEFLREIPQDHEVYAYTLTRKYVNTWNFEGTITLTPDYTEIKKFKTENVFSEAIIENIFNSKGPSQRIKLQFEQKG